MKLYRNKRSNAAPDAAPTAEKTAEAPETVATASPKLAKVSKRKQPETKPEAESASGEMVTIIKTGIAAKLSPRGDGQLTYQIGIGPMGDTVFVRIFQNESAGRFSREWVAVEKIRAALAALPKGTAHFKGVLVLQSAWAGKSACNPGFGAAICKSEGIFQPVPDKKGMLRLASPDALDTWERAILAIKIPKDAERVPLHPPKAPSPFKKRGVEEAPQVPNADADSAPTTDSEVDTVEPGEKGELGKPSSDPEPSE